MKEKDLQVIAEMRARHPDLAETVVLDLMNLNNPLEWFKSAASSGRPGHHRMIMHGCIRAYRGEKQELDPDTGDVMRYTFPAANELARVDSAFDMDQMTPFISDIIFYSDDPAVIKEIHKNDVIYDCRKFVAVFELEAFAQRLWLDKAVDLDDAGFPSVGGVKQRRKKK